MLSACMVLDTRTHAQQSFTVNYEKSVIRRRSDTINAHADALVSRSIHKHQPAD